MLPAATATSDLRRRRGALTTDDMPAGGLDNQTGPTYGRGALPGAINGVGDDSQTIYRRKKAAAGVLTAPDAVSAGTPPGALATIASNGTVATDAPPVDFAGDNHDTAVRAGAAAARQARTGGSTTFDPLAPAPNALAAISPSLPGALTSAGVDASQLFQQPAPTAGATPPGPAGKVAGALSAALPGGLSVPSDAKSNWLADNGVPLAQQGGDAIGGDGSGDNAAQLRRAAIRGGTAPGQNVRLGYDANSRIYGTSSRPGGPIDTFTGAGVADPNSPTTKIDGMGEVAARQVGLGITPGQSAAAASVAANRGNATQPLPGAVAYDPAGDVQDAIRDRNSDMASILSHDPRSALGIAARNLTVDLSSRRNRTTRFATGGQSPAEAATGELVGAIGQNFEARTNAAISRARNDTALAGIGTRADATRYAADARADSSEYGADARAGAARDVATTKADAPRINGAETKMFNDAYKRSFDSLTKNGMTPDEAHAHASELGTNAVLAYRKLNAGSGGAARQTSQSPTLEAFKAAAKKQGSRMSDADLQAAFQERYGAQ